MPAAPVMLRDSWTTVDGLRIYARVGTDGGPAGARPIVLIHGYGVSSRYLEPTAEVLAPYYPVYAPDLPGSGESEPPPHALTLVELADFVARWMETVGIRPATLLGNSFGCQVIAELAVRRPELVVRAVLVSPTFDPALRSLPRLLWRLILDAFRERPSHVFGTVGDYVRFGPRRAIATLRIMMRDRIETKLPRMTMPALVVRGGDDPLVSQVWAERVAELLPNCRLVVIPGAAHAVNYDAPEALTEVIGRFLTEAEDTVSTLPSA